MAAALPDPPTPPSDPITSAHGGDKLHDPPPPSDASSPPSLPIAPRNAHAPDAAGVLKDIVSNTCPSPAAPSDVAPSPLDAESSETRASKPPWKKPSVSGEEERRVPQPVLGAVIWPALSESRSSKLSSQPKKPKDSTGSTAFPKEGGRSETLPCSNDDSNSTNNPSQHLGGKYRPPPFKGNENNKPRNNTISGTDPLIKHEPKMKTNPPNAEHRAPFYRNDGMGNNMRKWRNNNRDQGKGNQGWYHHGRAYEHGRDMPVLLHEQRIGPRNMPRPPHPAFVNLNTGFYHPPNFPNGGVYYVPPGVPGVPGYVRTPPYFPPIVPPAGMMHGPDPITLRSMIMKQIEYYFSIENLCKDVYLRSNMDEQGFVPVTLLASFNRVQMLCMNPNLILESLQHSTVLEVQYDRVRRRNDWEKWILKPAESNLMREEHTAGDVKSLGESPADCNEITTRLENSLNTNTLSTSSPSELQAGRKNDTDAFSNRHRESSSTATSVTNGETSRRNDVHSPLSASRSTLYEQSPRLMIIDDPCSESAITLKSHNRESEDRLEVDNRDAQRFINVSHAQLGSVIAVP